MTEVYRTHFGVQYLGDSLEFLKDTPDCQYDLVITSPPFALIRKKEYGNASEADYVKWISPFCREVYRTLKPTGSFVIDLGGAYLKGEPVRSLYQFRVLIDCVDNIGFKFAQDFYWNNPSKLPSPIEWVNKRKVRVKDCVNTVWWLAKESHPKANASNVLVPYSSRMKKLLLNPEAFYTPKDRPSGHSISDTFSRNNGGALPSSLLTLPNTESNGLYLQRCKALGIAPHPARFPLGLPDFFIRFLTDEGDSIADIFSGSGVTNVAAERLRRRWHGIEVDPDYAWTSGLRHCPGLSASVVRNLLHHSSQNALEERVSPLLVDQTHLVEFPDP